MYRARVRLPVELQYLLRNELESAIEQAREMMDSASTGRQRVFRGYQWKGTINGVEDNG